jgi:hypothetical protein
MSSRLLRYLAEALQYEQQALKVFSSRPLNYEQQPLKVLAAVLRGALCALQVLLLRYEQQALQVLAASH